MARRLAFYIGQKFGNLSIISIDCKTIVFTKKKRTTWLCRCTCGSEKYYVGIKLTSGRVTGCGCRVGKTPKKYKNITIWNNPEIKRLYGIWSGIKNRCNFPSDGAYADYGGRGITICESWNNSFEEFFSDMGIPDSPDLSVGRIDNDLGYYPDNCRWETQFQQSSNKRNTRYVIYKGKNIKLIDLCIDLGRDRKIMQKRLDRGWSVERAILTPDRVRQSITP